MFIKLLVNLSKFPITHLISRFEQNLKVLIRFLASFYQVITGYKNLCKFLAKFYHILSMVNLGTS